MLRELCKGTPLVGKTEVQFYGALLAWESEIQEHESDTAGVAAVPFAEDLEKAIVMGNAPKELQTHLALLPASTTYADLRGKIEMYLRSKGAWSLGESVGDAVAMQVDAAIGGALCPRCGKPGHRSNECAYWQTKCNKCGKIGHLAAVCRTGSKGDGKAKDGKVKGKFDNKNGKSKDGKSKNDGGKSKSKDGGKGWQSGGWRDDADKYKNMTCYVCGQKGHPAHKCPKRWQSQPMEVGAIGQQQQQPALRDGQASEVSTGAPSHSASQQAPAGWKKEKEIRVREVDVVMVQTLEETYEQDWVLGCIEEVDDGIYAVEETLDVVVEIGLPSSSEFVELVAPVIGAVEDCKLLMVDSGAACTLFKKGDFGAACERPRRNVRLRNISGGDIPIEGEQTVRVKTSSGRSAQIAGTTTAETTRSVLGVADNVDNGFSVVFSPTGSYISKIAAKPPTDADYFVRRSRMWHLPVTEIGEEAEVARI